MKTSLLWLIKLAAIALSTTTMAQDENDKKDSPYYKEYPKQITARSFLSKKYTDFYMGASRPATDLRYRPNNGFSAGVGASYGVATLNLGFNLGFLDYNKDERGKTDFLDLQSHIYPRNWVIDLYGQFYKGYFLTPKGTAANNSDEHYLRPDMKVNLVGFSVYRLLQPHRFSYRAAFLQTEWQKKSAGSWLIGLEFYTGTVKGDSALLPTVADPAYLQDDIEQLRFTEFGPGLGYAYTGVIKEKFFFTGSVTINGDISFVKERVDGTSLKKTSISPNGTFRAVGGYNNDKWSLTCSWVNNRLNLRGRQAGDNYLLSTGNIRLTFAKRFRPGRKFIDKMKVLEADL